MRWTQYVGILLITGSGILYWTCQSSQALRYLSVAEIPRSQSTSPKISLRKNYLHYVPDTLHLAHTPMKFIRVNVHFMNSKDSTKNYNEARAREFGPKLIQEANRNLGRNQKMWLPHGNETAVLPVRYRYVLTPSEGYESAGGIYCHYDDDLFSFVSRGRNRNNYDREVIKRYGIGLDSIVNLFVMPHHPDSIKSETYKVTSAGIALGSGVKLSGIFETRKHPNAFRGLVNHEIGHVLGLKHSWNSNDGCDDTPRHQNCWNRTDDPPCDSLASNNLMDYNANQSAWTPCQIGRIHMNFARETSLQRKLLLENWCHVNPLQDIVITDSIVWNGAKDLEGNLTIGDGGYLLITNRVSLPKDAVLEIRPGGTLELKGAKLHNACGYTWKGIAQVREGQKVGRIVADEATVIENIPTALLKPTVEKEEK